MHEAQGKPTRVIGATLLVSVGALIVGSFFTTVDLVSKNGAESEPGIGSAIGSLVAAAVFIVCAVKLIEAAREPRVRQSSENAIDPCTTEKAADSSASERGGTR